TRHDRAPLAASAVARDHVRLAEIDLNGRNPGAGGHHELYLGGRGERDTQVTTTGAVRRPAIGQRCLVDRDRLSGVTTDSILSALVGDSCLSAASHDRPSHSRLSIVTTLVAVQILEDI